MVTIRITVPTLRVLQAFLAAGVAQTLYGRQLTALTGIQNGSLYPVLARLETAGWLTSSWEEQDPRTAGRPRRRYYRLTSLGQAQGAAALDEFANPQVQTPRQAPPEEES
jgi:PadR family transcriptional regulator, regulatory protein PadR